MKSATDEPDTKAEPMNIPRQRRYPMRPIKPTPAAVMPYSSVTCTTPYNITFTSAKTTPAKVAAAVAEAMKRYDRRLG